MEGLGGLTQSRQIKTEGGEGQNVPFALSEKCPRNALEVRPGRELCDAFCGNSNARHRRSQDWDCGGLDRILTSDALLSCEQTFPSRPRFHLPSMRKAVSVSQGGLEPQIGMQNA